MDRIAGHAKDLLRGDNRAIFLPDEEGSTYRAIVALGEVAEQIRGTAAFVLRGGGAPLLAAARRALDEAARKRIAGYERMTMGERITALQRPTAMDTASLTRALDPQMPPRGPGRSRALTDKLALIEQARRRLAFNAPTTP
jgi:hypothetical protein